VFDLAVSDIAARTTAVARGCTQVEKRRGVITGAEVTGRVDEGLDEEDRMAPGLHPVSAQPLHVLDITVDAVSSLRPAGRMQ